MASRLVCMCSRGKQVKEEVFQLDGRHRESHAMMLDVKSIIAAMDLEVKRLAAEVASVGVARRI